MKIMVVYDSQYGNTAQIAQAIGRGLRSVMDDSDDLEVLQVGDLSPQKLTGLNLLIVGSPTQRFRSTAATKDFLKNIPRNSLKGINVAAFDTRLTEAEIDSHGVLARFVHVFGYAAAPISKELEKKGAHVTVPPEGFYVTGMEGPLLDGELDRAEAWARRMIETQPA